MRPTVAWINNGAIRRNTEKIKEYVAGSARLMIMVKADGYGHGIVNSAYAALAGGADALGVAIPEEGAELRNSGVRAPILSVGALLNADDADTVVTGSITQGVFDARAVRLLADAAARANRPADVHIKVETGMNRLGVRNEDLPALLDAIDATNGAVHVRGVFTHFATSDAADKKYVYEQDARFRAAVETVKARYGRQVLAHASCSGAILDLPAMRYDMVRAGIIAYGYYPGPDVRKSLDLEPAFSLRSVVSNVKTVEAGEAIGYSRTFVAPGKMRIATVPIGYGDGYRVAYSNKGHMLVNGRPAPITGRVCMDQTMIDVTGCGDVHIGDEVVLIGRQGEACVWADEVAAWADTICYEVMLSISPRVRRVCIDE